MSRWSLFMMLCVAPLAAGCASTPVSEAVAARVTPGLSNVPWISGSTATEDQRNPDVISNGLDACGRNLEHSRLWNQWPPCPVQQPAVAGRQLLPTSDSKASAELVHPWQEVTLFGWPCTPRSRAPENEAVVICER
jgi:hypothetical protein